MKIKSLIIILFLLSICTANSPPTFQSVSGEFARKWIDNFHAQNPESVKKSPGNGNDLWNWGAAPKGSKIVDGKLVVDPYYLRSLLNMSSNWLGETYTDPGTGLPVETYVDPLTGKTIYAFLNPTSGQPFFTYYTYIDPNTGKLVYAYTDPFTGKTVYSRDPPLAIISRLSSGLMPQTFSNN